MDATCRASCSESASRRKHRLGVALRARRGRVSVHAHSRRARDMCVQHLGRSRRDLFELARDEAQQRLDRTAHTSSRGTRSVGHACGGLARRMAVPPLQGRGRAVVSTRRWRGSSGYALANVVCRGGDARRLYQWDSAFRRVHVAAPEMRRLQSAESESFMRGVCAVAPSAACVESATTGTGTPGTF